MFIFKECFIIYLFILYCILLAIMLLNICFWLKPKETKYVDLLLGGPHHKPRRVSRGSPWLICYLYNL